MRMVDAPGETGSHSTPASDLPALIGLAAAPVFALMACISAYAAPGMIMCSGVSATLPIDNMVLMYLLMGFFHLPPWMRLLSSRSPRRTPHTQGD